MKMNLDGNTVTMGAEVVEADFAIGDMAVILNILSSKMYSNPIKTICQEILSNARDAHREAGKASTPIEVKLPNSLDKSFHIKDFGPGISPDRMANVFMRYGTSTKRDSNNQTGGFGLGAKSPFAYSDTFGIVTVTPEHQFTDKEGVCHENCMVRRQYVAVRTGTGKMTLQTAEVTTDAQGTTIIVPCKPGDEKNFKKHVHDTAEYWDVKPEVKGDPNFTWKSHKSQFTATPEKDGFVSWRIDERDNDYYAEYANKPIAVIDGIQYPINTNNLWKDQPNQDRDISNLMSYPLRLFFKTGDLLMTANREEIDYQPEVIDTLRKRIAGTVKDLRQQLGQKIQGAKNLWEANCIWHKLSSTYGKMLQKVEWKAPDGSMVEVSGESLYLRDYKANVFSFTRSGTQLTRRTNYNIQFNDNSKLAIEDTDVKVPSKLRIATLFDADPKLTEVQVLVFTGADAKEVKDTQEKLEKEKRLSLFDPTYLSKVQKKAIVRAAGGGFKVAKCKKFVNGGYKSDQWREADVDLENDSGIYVELRGRDAYLFGTEKVVTAETLQFIQTDLKIEILGIPTRFLKNIGDDFEKLQDKVQKEVDKLKSDKDLQAYADQVDDLSNSFESRFNYLSQALSTSGGKRKAFLDLLTGKDSLARTYIETSEVVRKISDKVNRLHSLQKATEDAAKSSNNGTTVTLSKLADNFVMAYPLMVAINGWDARNIKTADLAFYINACDAARAKTTAVVKP
jgi:hypothetical protein